MAGKQAKQITADEAAALVKPGDWLDFGAALNQPDAFDRALAARRDELERVSIRACLTMRPRAIFAADPEGRHFNSFNWHFSGYDRKMHDAGLVHYIPCNLGEIPDYYRRFIDHVDIAILKAAPADSEGWFNLGPIGLWHPAVIERSRVIIIEVEPDMPRANGSHVRIHRSQVDYVIQGDGLPMPELPSAEPNDVDRAVARQIAAEIEDGSCLQVGIGGMPNAVTSLLLDSGVKELGVQSEMLNDGIGALYRAGRITGARKTVDTGKLTYSFALGSKELYDTIRNNPDLNCLPVEITNMPSVIQQNDNVVAINNTTQMDLQGQAASESDGHRHISGTGGQLQFVRGAYASKGGKSFVCLASTFEKKGIRKSRIVLNLTPGNIVTTPRSDQMYVVTEYGMTNLKGKSVAERARAMIGLAHPDYREELSRQARDNNLVPRFFL